MSDKLQQILNTMETFQKALAEESIIAVTDREKFVGYLPIKGLEVKIPLGAPITVIKNSITEKALLQEQTFQEERGPETFGFPYVATATPIWEDGSVVGVLTVSTTTEKVHALRSISTQLAASAEEMTATTDQLSGASSEMAAEVHKLAADSMNMLQEIEKIRSVSQIVRDVSEQSHLLGLNAAIEAARAGEQGRGFAVVASEIRKMAEQSKNSVATIDGELDRIEHAIKQMNKSIQGITAKFQEHAASIQELQAAFEHISSSADEILSASASARE
ncbi:methyl-accepting chemotaxis protein [Paenibacillus sp. MBLB4367]|uniref:methyl-accepting chemotaxis protein n=1 Tax=Paenibacillus sp. MBLB4367 TaxID=3384767 RepID=UPI00390813D5